MNVTFNLPITLNEEIIVNEATSLEFNSPATISLLQFTGGILGGKSDSIIVKVWRREKRSTGRGEREMRERREEKRGGEGNNKTVSLLIFLLFLIYHRT